MTANETAAPSNHPIICLSTRYSLGGAELNARMLASGFRRRGYAAETWHLMNDASMPEHEEGVRIFSDRVLPPWRLPAMIADLLGAVRRARPTALFGFQPFANIVGAAAARQVGARFIGTQRNPPESQSRVLGTIEKLIGSTSLYRANIAVSDAVRQGYGHYPGRYLERMRVVHNALPPLPPTDDSPADARRKLGIPDEGFVLGSLGRLADQKNVEFLIDVMALLPEHRLFVAGEGENEAAIRRRIEELGVGARVTLLGPLRGVDVTRFYRAIDMFLMPSRFEGFGRTLIEALGAGARTIATDLPVTREVSQESAILLPLDPPRWAAAIRGVAAEPTDARAAARRRGEEVANGYGMDRMIDGYLEAAGLPPHPPGAPAG